MHWDYHNFLITENYLITLTRKPRKSRPESVIVEVDDARNMYFHFFRSYFYFYFTASQQELKGSKSTRACAFFCHAKTPYSVNQDTLN